MLTVVALLVTGGALVGSEGIASRFAGRHVSEATAAVRAMPFPGDMAAWRSACGVFGLWCARSAEPPAQAAELVAATLREAGLDVDAVRCGAEAQTASVSLLAGLAPHDSQCTATAEVSGASLVVAAWDYLPPHQGDVAAGLPLGRTAVVVEWDSVGEQRLLALEPELVNARFGDVRVTPEEVATLPGALGSAQCGEADDEGCLFYEALLEGPGEHRAALEPWARDLLDAGLLVTTIRCPPEDPSESCLVFAEGGRDGGEQSRISVTLSVDPVEQHRIRARVQVG